MADAIIQVRKLVFDYPTVRALHGLDFEIASGTITALVGPNGAGKTTLLRCVAALETPLMGTVSVDGLDLEDAPRECHQRMGYLSDFFGLYDELSVERCLRHRAGAQGIAAEHEDSFVQRAAARTGLSDRLHQKAGELSRGLRQRLAIALAILHDPRIVLLDEPASGLDPEARQELSALLRALREEGMTLIVSSHILAELEEYSTHLMILRDGRLVEQRQLTGESSTIDLRIELATPHEAFRTVLETESACEVIGFDQASALVRAPREPQARAGLLKRLIDRGLSVSTFEVVQPDLQAAYLAHLREGPPN